MKIEITHGGEFKCLIEVLEDGTVKVLGAMNGGGFSVVKDVEVEVIED